MAAAAMCRRLVPRRLASAAWKNPAAIGHLRPAASPAAGFRWLTETSDDSAAEQGPVEKTGDPLVKLTMSWRLFLEEREQEKHKEKTTMSSKPDLGKHKEPKEAKFSWDLEDLLNKDFFKNQTSFGLFFPASQTLASFSISSIVSSKV